MHLKLTNRKKIGNYNKAVKGLVKATLNVDLSFDEISVKGMEQKKSAHDLHLL